MRLVRRTLCLVLAACTLLAPEAMAAIAWDETTALATYMAESPQIAAARRAVAVAQADVIAAEVWSNPTLDASREQIFSPGGPTEQNQLGLAVPVTIPGKRALKREIAETAVESTRAEVRMRLVELAFDFRRTYAEAYFEEARMAAMADGLAAYRRLESVVKARQKAGESAGYDSLRLQLQAAALDAQLAEHRTTARHARGHLDAALGRPVEGPLQLAALGSLPAEEALFELALAHRPELMRLDAERRAARLALDLANRERWPDPQVTLGLRQTNEPTVQGLGYAAGLAWPVPIFDQARAAQARALAQVERVDAENLALLARLRVEVAAGRQALGDRRATLTRFEASVLPRARRVVQVAELAYQEGEQGIVALLDAHEAGTQARLQHVELAEAAHTAMLELETLIGRPLPATLGDLE